MAVKDMMKHGMETVDGMKETMLPQDREMKIGLRKPGNSLIYGASLISVLLSLFTVRRNPSLASFFGLWAPTILGLGILFKENKLIEMNKQQHYAH